MSSTVGIGKTMKRLLAIGLVLVLPAFVLGCMIQTAPPPQEPAPAATTTAAPAATTAPAPTAEPAPPPKERKKMGVPNLGHGGEEEETNE